MFTFINLTIFTALAVIIFPLLIHLFNRQKKVKIEFSSIRFLKFIEKKRLKRLKLFEYLLLVIRTLTLLMIIFAFSRPTLTTNSLFYTQKARTTAIIILDSGINMRRYDDLGSRYHRAYNILEMIKGDYSPEDQIFFLTTSKPQEIYSKHDDLPEQEAAFKGSDWASVFQTAQMILNNHPNFNKELFIISDFQFRGDEFLSALPLISGNPVYFIKIGENSTFNVGIDTLKITSQILEVDKPINFEISVKSSDIEDIRPLELHLFIDKKRVSHRRTMIQSDVSEVVQLSYIPQNPGITSGYIEISDDNLLADNRYYFVFDIPSEVKILFVDDKPSSYIQAAITSLSSQSNISITENKYNAWTGQNFQKFDIIWLSNSPKFDVQIENRLKDYLSAGGGLIIMPGFNTVPSDFNRFAKNINLSTQIIENKEISNTSEFYSLKPLSLNNPLFNGLFRSTDPDIETPHIYRYYKMKVSAMTERVLSFNNNDPFLINEKVNEGFAYIFSSYVDDKWTDIQFHGIFIPLLYRIIYQGISSTLRANLSSQVGEQHVVSVKNPITIDRFYIIDADENKNDIVPKIVDQTYQFILPQIEKPGLYKIITEQKLIAELAVNCNPRTIQRPYVDLAQLPDKDFQYAIFDENHDFLDSVKEARFGTELWKLFIILTIILIAIETIFIKKMEGKGKNGVE